MKTRQLTYNKEIYYYGEIIPLGFDTFFKSFFLNNKNAIGYKASLLSEITGIPKKDFMNDVEFSSEELPNSSGFSKSQSVDILIKMNKTVINLEMNKNYYFGLSEKNLSYVAKLFSTVMGKGEQYNGEIKAIQISFDNFDMFKTSENGEPKLKREFALMDVETHELYTSQMVIIHINLDCVKKKVYNKEELNELERLLIPFVGTKKEQMAKFNTDKEAKDAIDFMKELSNKNTLFTDAEREAMQKWENERILEYAKYEAGQAGHKAGLEKGRVEGLEKGLAEGRKEGLANGINQEKKEVASKMLNKNMNIKTISEITGLTEEEILKL